MNRNLVRALLLGLIALGFGLSSFRYSIGNLSNAGPGLFPLMISSMLLAVAILMMIRAHYDEPVRFQIGVKRIFFVLAALIGFVLASKYLGMLCGIFVLVFVATLAGSSYSWKRNIQVSVALGAVAFALQTFLGLNIGLY